MSHIKLSVIEVDAVKYLELLSAARAAVGQAQMAAEALSEAGISLKPFIKLKEAIAASEVKS